MRYSQKAWTWNSIQGYTAGSMPEAFAVARAGGDEKELQILKGRSRGLLPRT
ncbi:hypothetical protein [Paenibacillus sp. MMS20-IR301]|uniref:hypothetical protein n=1 Tax=Paenibacillus sp. MMS20-IR301 TaxID=2895946 RepID=UPI0028EBAA16|nr:hypothetical protein [Paenibacillus sp. MMS20-IR301]WNS43659.1 hypothetical protein LOS79_32860 [Paenibacillus sp. MMS20-IR301]